MAKRCSYVRSKKGPGFQVGRTGATIASGPATPAVVPAKHTAKDWITAITYNSMLSGPRTLMVNIASGAIELPYKMLRDATTQNPEKTAWEFMGAVKNIDDAFTGAMRTITTGVNAERAAAMGIPVPASAPGGIAMNAPTRVLGAVDEFFHQLAYGLEMGRAAFDEANKAKLPFKDRAKLIDDLMDTPSEEMTSRALDAANRLTFKGELGTAGESFENSMKSLGVVGNLIAPFIRTPYHITARGIDRSPIGLAATIFDTVMDAMGQPKVMGKALGSSTKNPPKAERLADGMIGTIFTGWAFSQAMQDNITGSGPENSNERAALERKGWQPNSIRVGGRYISYQQLGSWAVPLAAAGAAADTLKYKTGKNEPGEKQVTDQVLEIARRFSESWTENGYMSGLGDLAAIMEGKGAGALERQAASIVSRFVPFSAASRSVAQSQDPSARAPEGVGERLLQNMPQLPGPLEGMPDRQSVPSALDVYGREKPNTYSGFSAVVPVRQQLERSDPVDEELARVDVNIGPTPKEIAGKELTRDQARDYQLMGGANTYAGLQVLMKDGDYVNASQAEKTKQIAAVVKDARERAAELVLAPADRPIKETGLPPKYVGVNDAGEERRIDAIISKVNEYRAQSKKDWNNTPPEPSEEEWDIYGNYRNNLTEEYQEAVKARARQSEETRKVPLPFDARKK